MVTTIWYYLSDRYYYLVILGFALLLLTVGGFLALSENPWATFGALIAGGAASLLASALIQIFASREQTKLLSELALSAEGVQSLPSEFRKLEWLAHATTAPTETGTRCEWRVVDLKKYGDTGQKFAVYRMPAKNLVNEEALYTCTFVGLKGSVAALVSLGDERTSVITFDTLVPSAGIYFGPAYITNWFGERDLTLAVTGLGAKPNPKNWPPKIREAFREWHKSVKWNVEPLIKEFELPDEQVISPEEAEHS